MKIIRSINKINLPKQIALTIGNFDGLHLGHLEIIQKVKKIAKEKNIASAILTFEPHPLEFLRPEKNKDFRIGNLAQKLKNLIAENLDYIIILPFNEKLASLDASSFIDDILVKNLKVKDLIIGYDFVFGKNREGSFKLLEEKSKKLNFNLHEIPAIKNQDYTCSSTIIRSLILQGKIKEANQILGRNFSISSRVVNGKKLAKQIGFPTANLKVNPYIIKPKFGVYKTSTYIPFLKQKFSSITNFGIRPTVENNDQNPIFETHILNFNQEIYGKKIIVEFLDFIREEKKFDSIDDLKRQITADVLGKIFKI